MDVYVTFYDVVEKYKAIFIHNGFSFGRRKNPEDVDLFFSNKSTTEEIVRKIENFNPKKVWCSITTSGDFRKVIESCNENWIIGGPFVNLIEESKILDRKLLNSSTLVRGPIEFYYGSELSSDFDFYFSDLIKSFKGFQIVYNTSIGTGCYWNQCRFCNYWKYCGKSYLRPNIEKIVSGLETSPYYGNIIASYVCISSTPPHVIKRMVSSKKKETNLVVYIRAERNVIDQIKEFDDLEGFSFSIGFEGLSQKVLDDLDKGMKEENILELVKFLLERKALVRISLMNNYSFLSKDIVEDYKRNLTYFENLKKKYKGLTIRCHGPVLWPTKELAEKYGFPSKKMSDSVLEYYITHIPENSEQFKFNSEIDELLQNSTVSSRTFESFTSIPLKEVK